MPWQHNLHLYQISARRSGYAIQNYGGYSEDLQMKKIVGLFPDRGERYLDTIYNTEWCNKVGIDIGLL